jgi:hypothetical protein
MKVVELYGRVVRGPDRGSEQSGAARRLGDEHGFAGGYTVVKDYVRISRTRERETFVPLAHPPGHAQVDFGEAVRLFAVSFRARLLRAPYARR